MKIREIEYSRLFNLTNYQNERIGFKAEITDSEDPNAVIGQLFFKVLEIERIFQRYRDLLREISYTEDHIDELERRIEHYNNEIAELERRLTEYKERKDIRQCMIVDTAELLENTKERLENAKFELQNTVKQLEDLRKKRRELEQLIKAGNFDFEGV